MINLRAINANYLFYHNIIDQLAKTYEFKVQFVKKKIIQREVCKNKTNLEAISAKTIAK